MAGRAGGWVGVLRRGGALTAIGWGGLEQKTGGRCEATTPTAAAM